MYLCYNTFSNKYLRFSISNPYLTLKQGIFYCYQKSPVCDTLIQNVYSIITGLLISLHFTMGQISVNFSSICILCRSGVLNVNNLTVSHLHCPPPAWL
jgi:hypothetical protein